MAVTRALRRLLHIRDLEEEQCRLALEAAMTERRRLEAALSAVTERDRRGRRLVLAGVRSAELTDRVAGLEETQTARRLHAALTPRLAQMEQLVAARRQQYLTKRVERRQAETLISETQQRDAAEAGRRAQQSLDDWFGNRVFRTVSEEKSPRPAPDRRACAVPPAAAPSDAADET